MPPVVSSAKALARLLAGRNHILDPRCVFSSSSRSLEKLGKLNSFPQNRSFTRIARIGNPCIDSLVEGSPCIGGSSNTQTRRFIGVGDGQEGDCLSKIYEERRIMGYSQEQMFAVVAAVDMYEDFVPWCQRSQILKKNSDGSFDAELEIGFKFLVESYISHVELKKPNYIKVASVFFKEVVARLVGSFNDRCQKIYGPGVRVLETSYGHGR